MNTFGSFVDRTVCHAERRPIACRKPRIAMAHVMPSNTAAMPSTIRVVPNDSISIGFATWRMPS